MTIQLSPAGLRVLGSLLEKEATTPDVYPLSLNALTAACNQLSNREPVMSLSDVDVRNAVNALRQEGLVRAIQPSGSKVLKFQHLLAEKLNVDARERAVLCVLMLRGGQTVGEIRSRTGRLADFPSLADVESTLQELVNRHLVAEQARRPGQKETRFVQLLGEQTDAEESRNADPPASAHDTRVDALERTVDELRREIAELRGRVDEFQRELGG